MISSPGPSRLDARHADLDLGLADGTVVATAERYQAAAILSMDNDYRVAAPSFPLLPD